MKVVCGGCQAKYQVPDERVAGKKLKIRCRRCSETIIVRGDTVPGGTRDSAVGRNMPAISHAPPPSPMGDTHEWFASVDGGEHGPMDRQALIAWLESSPTAWEAYVWREGFSAWKVAREVPELVTAAGREHRERHGSPSLHPLPMSNDVDWDDEDAEPTRMLKLQSPRISVPQQNDLAASTMGHRASISAFGAHTHQHQAQQAGGQFDMRAAGTAGGGFRSTAGGFAGSPAAFSGGPSAAPAGGPAYGGGGYAPEPSAPPSPSIHNSGFRPATERRYTPPPTPRHEPEDDEPDLIDYDEPGRASGDYGEQGRGFFGQQEHAHYAEQDASHHGEQDNGHHADQYVEHDNGHYSSPDHGYRGDNGTYDENGAYDENGGAYDENGAYGEQAYHGGPAYASSAPPVPHEVDQRPSTVGYGHARGAQDGPFARTGDSPFGGPEARPSTINGGWGDASRAAQGAMSSGMQDVSGFEDGASPHSGYGAGQQARSGSPFGLPETLSPTSVHIDGDEKAKKWMPYAIIGAATTLVAAVVMVFFLLQSDESVPTTDASAATAAAENADPAEQEAVVPEPAEPEAAAMGAAEEPESDEYDAPAAPPAARRRRGVGLGVEAERRRPDPSVEAANRARLEALNRGEAAAAAESRAAAAASRREMAAEEPVAREASRPVKEPASNAQDPMADLMGGDSEDSSNDPMAGLDAESGSARAVAAPAGRDSSGDSLDDLLKGVGDKPAAAAPSADGDPSIDDLLSGAVKSDGASRGGANLPEQPARDDVLKSLKSVTPRVQRCATGAGITGMAKVTMTVEGATGRVSSASVSGVDGAAGECIKREVQTASFPKFRKPQFNVTFPFRLQ